MSIGVVSQSSGHQMESESKDDPSQTTQTTQYGTKTASGNSRIFSCHKCSRAFTREEHLSRHVFSTHNKLKPFACGICSRPFARRDLLLRHAKNLHGGSEQAVSRIRKSYRRASSGGSGEEQSQEGSSASELPARKPANKAGMTGIEADRHDESITLSPLEKYTTSDKKETKMSVKMLVS